MIEKVEQGTPEWFAARLGNVTASRVADVIAKTKSGYSASRENYMAQLICERMTNTVAESYSNAAMQWGTETEPLARAAYESYADVLVDEVGYIANPWIKRAGASPDGLIGKWGLIEIKCPNTATHIDTLLSETVPTKYITQMQWQMACTGRVWCDFVSFDPRLPDGLQLFVKRVERDAEYIAMLEQEVIKFLTELDEKIFKLNERLNHVQ
ncbi:phage_rel_nuc, putative phage-type endonuclease [uncultured Caudovirales phage]|uniref:Phage_rel_nuc, putative phage-type endonuclease n=1 Tax=uncultured Caudovirales phage TaxID=2100421 RepID=A0A6J7WAP1_9CAUD|nr:phage_rel_nuc, putative phage-type endonuclease [uncultured Caudovirales phage]